MWAARPGGTEADQSGRLVKWEIPGAATTASAITRSPLSSTASNRLLGLASSATRSSRTSIPLACRNQSA